MGVHPQEDFDCQGEYDSYLPEIVDLVTGGASLDDVADALYEFEEMIMGEHLKSRRRCHIAAAKNLGRNPLNYDHTMVAHSANCARSARAAMACRPTPAALTTQGMAPSPPFITSTKPKVPPS